MKMKMNNGERVMVFIDLRNVTNVPKHFGIGAKVDLECVVEEVVGDRRLVAAYVFDGEKSGNDGFYNSLESDGFIVVTRNSYDGFENRQKEVDMAMGMKIAMHAFKDDYDTAIIVSGDRDFCPAAETVQSLGKKVEVASFSITISSALYRCCDVYHDLDDVELFYGFRMDRDIEQQEHAAALA